MDLPDEIAKFVPSNPVLCQTVQFQPSELGLPATEGILIVIFNLLLHRAFSSNPGWTRPNKLRKVRRFTFPAFGQARGTAQVTSTASDPAGRCWLAYLAVRRRCFRASHPLRAAFSQCNLARPPGGTSVAPSSSAFALDTDAAHIGVKSADDDCAPYERLASWR